MELSHGEDSMYSELTKERPSWSAEADHANGAHRRMGIHGKQVCWAIMTWGWQLLSGKVGNWYAGLLGNNEQQRLLSYVEVGNCYGLGSAPAIISQLPLTLLLHYLLPPPLLPPPLPFSDPPSPPPLPSSDPWWQRWHCTELILACFIYHIHYICPNFYTPDFDANNFTH